MQLMAEKVFSYDGKYLRPGDRFKCREQHARVLVAIGKASIPEGLPVFDPKPAKVAEPAPTKPAELAVVAEPIAEPPEHAVAEEPEVAPEDVMAPEPVAPTRRQYRRRDLTAADS